MNICILTSSFPSHPDDHIQAPFLIDFIEGLKRRNHQVFIFTHDRFEVKEEFLKGVKVKWFPWMKTRKPLVHLNPVNPLDFVRVVSLFWMGRKTVIPYIKENKIDVCFALWVLPSGYFANYVYRKAGISYSVWALGSDIYRHGENLFLRPLMKRIIQEARGVFADGFNLARKVKEQFGKNCEFLATSRKFIFEYDKPRKPDKLKGPDEPNELGKPYHFLFVGRLEKVKGIDVLLQAVAGLSRENLNFHLTVVGSGGMEAWAKAFLRREGIEQQVTLTGILPDFSLASLYQSSDCVVIPSRSDSIPLVFSEALNFGRELIVTDVGDMGTLGQQYGVADVVPPENVLVLKEALKKKILFRKDKPRAEGRGKKEELLRLFDIETSVERFLEDYKD